MLTIKEVSEELGMSQFSIRKGITTGLYPAIRVANNPRGKILINIDEFTATLNRLANANLVNKPSFNNLSNFPIVGRDDVI